jgi:hypothetical protein
MINALRNLIFRDFWLKLFSLLLAVAIWKIVSFAIHKEEASSPSSSETIQSPEKKP